MFFAAVTMVAWSPGRLPHPQLLDIVKCSAAAVVVACNKCSVVAVACLVL